MDMMATSTTAVLRCMDTGIGMDMGMDMKMDMDPDTDMDTDTDTDTGTDMGMEFTMEALVMESDSQEEYHMVTEYMHQISTSLGDTDLYNTFDTS